jgi:23S rRNA pseudouridine1911/1915/1917 synthase
VEIERGVTHQIRVHLQAAGHPLVGDPLYGAGRTNALGLERQFLHAAGLEFRHPKDGRKIVVKSPLPEDLRRVLDRLGMKV